MTLYHERLLDRADTILGLGGVIPLDLHAELMEAGMDTSEIERKHAETSE